MDSYNTHEHTSVHWPAITYIHQLCEETGCRLEDLPSEIVHKNGSILYDAKDESLS